MKRQGTVVAKRLVKVVEKRLVNVVEKRLGNVGNIASLQVLKISPGII